MRFKCVFGCGEYQHLYRFPLVCKRRTQLWASALDLEVAKIGPNHRVCDRHFKPEHKGKKLLRIDAVPVKRVTNASTPKTSAGVSVESNSDDTGFETINPTAKTQSARTYCDKSTNTTLQAHIPFKSNDTQGTPNECIPPHSSSEIDGNVSDEDVTSFDPVGTAFKAPPKRTYDHVNSTYAKKPKHDITATCYCRCHKGEDENKKLKRKIHEMKITIGDQSREINLLISKNKDGEHQLQEKVKKISELMNLETSLRKAIEELNIRISTMTRRQIQPAPNASDNSIILSRMICDRRKKYTKSEVLVANKLYAISGRCYYFMRDVLKLNLPHPTTLLRNRNIPDEHVIYKAFDGDPIEHEQQEAIVFSPEPKQEEELQIAVDV